MRIIDLPLPLFTVIMVSVIIASIVYSIKAYGENKIRHTILFIVAAICGGLVLVDKILDAKYPDHEYLSYIDVAIPFGSIIMMGQMFYVAWADNEYNAKNRMKLISVFLLFMLCILILGILIFSGFFG